MKRRTDHEEIGLAPHIGVNGHAVIAHSNFTFKAIKNATLRAAQSAKTNLPETLKKVIAEANSVLAHPQVSSETPYEKKPSR